MKKALALLIILAVTAALAACGTSPDPAMTGADAPPAAVTDSPTEAVTEATAPTELPLLSQMTEEECAKTLRAIEPKLPEELPFDLMSLVRGLEEDIDMPYWSDVYFTPEHSAFELVRTAVKEYYGGKMPDDTASLPSTVPDPPGENQYMWLISGDDMVLPYKAFAYGASYVEPYGDNNGGMLHADGKAFFNGILSEADEFPAVGPDLEIVLYDSCALAAINVYDAETHEPVVSNIGADEFKELISASGRDLIAVMTAVHTGRYIEAIGESEYDAYMFGFIVKCGGR